MYVCGNSIYMYMCTHLCVHMRVRVCVCVSAPKEGNMNKCNNVWVIVLSTVLWQGHGNALGVDLLEQPGSDTLQHGSL